MLKLLLSIYKFVYREPCSIQKEIANRYIKGTRQWECDDAELIELYDHLNFICKKRRVNGKVTITQFFSLLKYPQSTLNFLKGKKVSFNLLQGFKKLCQTTTET